MRLCLERRWEGREEQAVWGSRDVVMYVGGRRSGRSRLFGRAEEVVLTSEVVFGRQTEAWLPGYLLCPMSAHAMFPMKSLSRVYTKRADIWAASSRSYEWLSSSMFSTGRVGPAPSRKESKQ